jgi:hypothetical protein
MSGSSRNRSRSRNRDLPPEIKVGDKVILRPDYHLRYSRQLRLRDLPLDTILTVERVDGDMATLSFRYSLFPLPLESLEHIPYGYVSTPPRSRYREEGGGGRRRQTRRKRKGTRRH